MTILTETETSISIILEDKQHILFLADPDTCDPIWSVCITEDNQLVQSELLYCIAKEQQYLLCGVGRWSKHSNFTYDLTKPFAKIDISEYNSMTERQQIIAGRFLAALFLNS